MKRYKLNRTLCSSTYTLYSGQIVGERTFTGQSEIRQLLSIGVIELVDTPTLPEFKEPVISNNDGDDTENNSDEGNTENNSNDGNTNSNDNSKDDSKDMDTKANNELNSLLPKRRRR